MTILYYEDAYSNNYAIDRRRPGPTYPNWREMQIELGQFSTIPSVNMDRIVLLEYVESADDVHKSPTTAGLSAKLNSAQLRRQVGIQCLGQIMIRR